MYVQLKKEMNMNIIACRYGGGVFVSAENSTNILTVVAHIYVVCMPVYTLKLVDTHMFRGNTTECSLVYFLWQTSECK